MAVENDYELLVFNLNEVADELQLVRGIVRDKVEHEAAQGLEPNDEEWVNVMAARLGLLEARFLGLIQGARDVLLSEPGEAVFDQEAPARPDFPEPY